MITLFGIANCDTIKKTKLYLDSIGAAFEFHDYKKLGIDEALAVELLNAIPLDSLINKRGTTWRKLSPEEQAALAPETALALIRNNTSLVRRPIIKAGTQWHVGYDETAISAIAKTV